MQMHLFSSSDPLLQNIREASKEYLHNCVRPVVLYIPPRVKPAYELLTNQVFKDMAEVRFIDLSIIKQDDFQQALQDATLIFIPGGNTFYLNHQLHQKGLLESIRQALLHGTPYVGMSAGTLITGENILTSNDMNACGCTDFTGLRMLPYNFLAHFPLEAGTAREAKIDRITEYHEFHENPVLALEDDAQLWVNGDIDRCESGNIWLFEKGKEPVKFISGSVVPRPK